MEVIRTADHDEKTIIAKAVEVLKAGGTVVYPTETCYGIGVDATSEAAVTKLMQYKSRREGKPLSVAVVDKAMAAKYIELNEIAENLYDNYLPGPITVVSKGLGKVAPGVESEYGTLGIRIPDYPLILEIVKTLGLPVTSTSANASYEKKPYKVDDIFENISQKQKDLIDLVIDAGELPERPASTVVDTTLNNLNVMREGAMQFAQSVEDKNLSLHAKTNSAAETEDFGSMVMLKYIDRSIERPVILAMKGEMGSGKTQFVRGIARGLKIKETPSSPTYTIIDEYGYELAGRAGKLVHMDTWRVDGIEEFNRTGLSAYLVANNVIAIEWADKFYPELAELIKQIGAFQLNIEFSYLSETSREIKVFEV